jgi:hypothetical protein
MTGEPKRKNNFYGLGRGDRIFLKLMFNRVGLYELD